MKKLLPLLFVLVSIKAYAQSDSFKLKESSFQKVEDCVTIPAHYDMNDQPMAVIKTIPENICEEERSKLVFESDLATNIEVEQHLGETWGYETPSAASKDIAESPTAQTERPMENQHLKRNLSIVLGTEAVLYAGSMTGLYYLWYADYPQSAFHFYNDNAEWLQMDKAGHATTAYHVGLIGYEALRLAGWDEKHSLLYGGPLGFVFLTTVEVFDGLSDGWGFSWGDMAANALGTGLFMGQQALWHEQRISMKYSYHNTQFPQYRPDLLGSTLPERMLKDYNGQTIWLSFNIKSLFMNDESKFPSWINVALGYSAEGMTGGFYNTTNYNGQIIPEFDRVRQFVLSPDIDLTRIPVKNKFLKSTLKVLSFIKIPMPAVMCDSQGNFSWHWIYF